MTRMFALQPLKPCEHSAQETMVGHANSVPTSDSKNQLTDLYYSDIKSSVPSIMKQLGNEGWSTRREVIRMLTMLAEHGSVFHDPSNTCSLAYTFC